MPNRTEDIIQYRTLGSPVIEANLQGGASSSEEGGLVLFPARLKNWGKGIL